MLGSRRWYGSDESRTPAIRVPIPPEFELTFAVFAFAWGAVWGSFLNVVIWRLPRGMSLSRPASHCPSCSTPIRWYDNVPVLGWVWLRGRCRACRTPISARYPGVEALVGALSLALWLHAAAGRLSAETLPQVVLVFVLHFYLMAALVAIAFIDLDLTIIPHRLSIPLIGWGFLSALLYPKTGVWAAYFPQLDLVQSLLGFGLGFGLLYAVFTGYRVFRGVDGGGGGDLWLLGAIGANLGWLAIPFVLFAASFQGVLAAVLASVVERFGGRGPGEGALLIRGAHREEYWQEHPVLGSQSGVLAESDAPAPAAPAEATDGAPHDAPAVASESGEDEGFLKLAVPFGPFLALAAIEYVFFGRAVLAWATSGILP